MLKVIKNSKTLKIKSMKIKCDIKNKHFAVLKINFFLIRYTNTIFFITFQFFFSKNCNLFGLNFKNLCWLLIFTFPFRPSKSLRNIMFFSISDQNNLPAWLFVAECQSKPTIFFMFLIGSTTSNFLSSTSEILLN